MRLAKPIILVFICAFLAFCGIFKKAKEDDDDGTTFGGRIPSDWNPKDDWRGSAWTVSDE